MGKNRRDKNSKKECFGKAEFYCSKCGHHFKMDWEAGWDIQESTHGYVGYQLYDTYISCEKCGEIISDDDNMRKSESINPLRINMDDEIPF